MSITKHAETSGTHSVQQTESPELHELICTEVWGGNRTTQTDVKLAGLTGTIFSRSCSGLKGGDIHYLSSCMAGLVGRICLADVVGHGESVSQMSNWLYEILRQNMNRIDPVEIFTRVNNRVVDVGIKALTTAACLSYDWGRGELRYAYAGHQPAWLYKAGDKKWVSLDLSDQSAGTSSPRNLPLGITNGIQYDVGKIELREGDKFILCSDGVTETPDSDNNLYSNKRLSDLLYQNQNLSCAEMCQCIIDSLIEYSHDKNLQHDDVTLMIMEVIHRPRGPRMWHMLRNNTRKYLPFLFR